MKEKVGLCEVCFNLAEGPRCRICDDERRDRTLICVVEEPADVIPIERTHEFRGLYHVLGGALSPIDGVDPDDLKIAELVGRVDGESDEVVLATNPTTTGEATALHIAELLRGQVTITRLASGLPVGADLEHADEVTLGRALAGRRRSSRRLAGVAGVERSVAPAGGRAIGARSATRPAHAPAIIRISPSVSWSTPPS